MYFAMSGIQGTSGQSFVNDTATNFSNEPGKDFVSIFRINYNILKECFSIKEISDEVFDSSSRLFDSTLSSYDFHFWKSELIKVKLGLVLSPIKNSNGNYNLTAQKGCFLYFDNTNGWNYEVKSSRRQKVDLIALLNSHEQYHQFHLPEPVMTIFKIKYNSFMWEKQRVIVNGDLDPNHLSAFEFLRRKNITGKNLFDDIQGIKYDFNYFHHRDR